MTAALPALACLLGPLAVVLVLFWMRMQAWTPLGVWLGTIHPDAWAVAFPLLALFLPLAALGSYWQLVGVRDARVRRLEVDGYLYLYPALLILTFFHLFPVLYALAISFFQASAEDPFHRFVGWENFSRLFEDPVFWGALANTAWYAVLTVLSSIVVSLAVALLLNQKLRGQGIYRTIYFLPVVTSVAAVSLVWKLLFHPQRGLLNAGLELIGLPALQWLQEGRGVFEMFYTWLGGPGTAFPAYLPPGPSLALVSVALMSVWKVFGYNVVLFLAGLQNIPQELYEAATIDRASKWDRFRHITWPLLSPTTFFILVVSTISSFQVFAQIFMLYGGNATETSRVIVYYLYEKAFQSFDLGYASAIAFVLFLILFVLTIVQRTFVGRRVHYANSPA